jgi:RNA polymerase sigma-70 factor (ECF subfamily)
MSIQTEMPPNSKAQDAYSTLVKRLEPEILRHALRLARDMDWASDLVQDAVIAGYPLYLDGTISEAGNLRGWFMRVVTNRFINELKRKTRWTSSTPIEDVQTSRSAEADEAVDQLLSEPLEAALGELSLEHRLCILLVDVQGLDYLEASKILEIPIGTVRSRLARARLRLYTLLLPYARSQGYI